LNKDGSAALDDADGRPTATDWAVRAYIYQRFARTGEAPVLAEVAAVVGATEFKVRTALERLYAAHEIAPLPSGGGVWMANPFSAVATGYRVETPHMACYANCAWDALGVAAILESDARVATRCAQSGTALEYVIQGRALLQGDGVIHLVTPVRDAWIDIGFT
jgi:hypothetical protein